jgi:ketopantoate hydroxymethyltransferase
MLINENELQLDHPTIAIGAGSICITQLFGYHHLRAINARQRLATVVK